MTTARRVGWGFGLAVVAVALILDVSHRPEPIGIDFHTYLAAARVGLQQGWQHIYDQALVADAQRNLVPAQPSQPFLSPPSVAWLVAPLTALPYWVAYYAWAALTLLVLAAGLTWSAVDRGIRRWVGVVGALSPWWVMHAVNLGQVVPLVAAGAVIAWKFLRDDKDVAAGMVLSVVLLKPNTAFLAPILLLAAGRYRAFAAWLAVAIVVAAIVILSLGGHGVSAYWNELRAPLPAGADDLTLRGAMGVGGAAGLLARILVAGVVVITAFKLRGSSVLALPLGLVASLVVSPYLHASDLCMFAVAAWMVWDTRQEPGWRVPLAAGWLLVSPFFFQAGLSPGLTRLQWLEVTFLLGLVIVAWRPRADVLNRPG